MSQKPKREWELSREESAALSEIVRATRERRGEEYSFNSLVNRWAILVHQVEQGYDDSIYEYTNDLSVRDILAEIIAKSPSDLKRKLVERIRIWDQRFLSATRPSKRPLGRRPDVQDVVWWNRVPAVLTEELEADLRSDDML